MKYKYCITKDECYQSFEYLKPTLNTNYNKVLLKINATLTLDDSVKIVNIYSPYSLINYFGSIVYKINGKTYTISNGISKVDSYRISTENDYYLEVNENIMQAEEIYLIIDIRNKQYKYKIK